MSFGYHNAWNTDRPSFERSRPVYSRPPRPAWCPRALAIIQKYPQIAQYRPQIVAYINRMCAITQPIPPQPQPRPRPSGCGPGRRFDSCLCKCVPQNAITPQCIRNCTSCGVGQTFNWCLMRCIDSTMKIKQCPPLN